ncbi:hypothetical protein MMPV_000379 [Pyropia vietnamensis]
MAAASPPIERTPLFPLPARHPPALAENRGRRLLVTPSVAPAAAASAAAAAVDPAGPPPRPCCRRTRAAAFITAWPVAGFPCGYSGGTSALVPRRGGDLGGCRRRPVSRRVAPAVTTPVTTSGGAGAPARLPPAALDRRTPEERRADLLAAERLYQPEEPDERDEAFFWGRDLVDADGLDGVTSSSPSATPAGSGSGSGSGSGWGRRPPPGFGSSVRSAWDPRAALLDRLRASIERRAAAAGIAGGEGPAAVGGTSTPSGTPSRTPSSWPSTREPAGVSSPSPAWAVGLGSLFGGRTPAEATAAATAAADAAANEDADAEATLPAGVTLRTLVDDEPPRGTVARAPLWWEPNATVAAAAATAAPTDDADVEEEEEEEEEEEVLGGALTRTYVPPAAWEPADADPVVPWEDDDPRQGPLVGHAHNPTGLLLTRDQGAAADQVEAVGWAAVSAVGVVIIGKAAWALGAFMFNFTLSFVAIFALSAFIFVVFFLLRF